ncbi:hypothetical protein, unknown function [Leishmania braziliensis MHOM/BR/75/M2904]|uniref:C2H2-type domain-containing protein n=1 Tax=Leishmania braziliensis TaxID=5660 RepID=A4HDV0_LEIBR|nr:hypothetical protein, unknown function [Leishmania braziliensis MHOM/BR/75/M2904]KAI5690177.1 hypothetical protein MNV84_04335 [Leishmania braziliensis]CAJ2473945.1 unnamed protein product [Leishmania braziliensis]CAM39002.2 hypothetical protein, unknown function [Leishmania braziliensis MHOM/BR/75/M2904]
MPETRSDEVCHRTQPETRVLPDPLSILLVGEGNLSFTYALVKRLSSSAAVRRATRSDLTDGVRRRDTVVEVTATTFDSAADLLRKYPEAGRYLTYFAAKQRVRVRYFGGVNATSLSSVSAALRDSPSHLLIFNNPHIGFEDLYRQRSLLSHFFRSARDLHIEAPTVDYPQEVVVTLCDDQAQRWDLLGCAARSGYLCVAAVPLRSVDFPEYTNRRHQSAAAFPFRIMVQYYFVAPQVALHEELCGLSAELMLWEQERRSRAEDGLPCRYTCVEWLRVAKRCFGLCSEAPAGEAQLSDAAASRACASSSDAFSVNITGCSAEQPLPLLHPTLVDRVVGATVMAPGFAQPSVGQAGAFMPYLPRSTWVSLYRAQRLAERQPRSPSAIPAPKNVPPLPPHLDALSLGRELTSRESKKLDRYLCGYGPAMKARADQRRQAATETPCSWGCDKCRPPRIFETEDDLRQHHAAKHFLATQLAPTLYARVQEQIETPMQRLEDALNDMHLRQSVDQGYCDVCDLQFKSVDAYEEHLRYLAPLPVDDVANLVCDVCQPAKCFTDRRALVQHQATKHSLVDWQTRKGATPAKQ